MDEESLNLMKRTYGFEEFYCPKCQKAICSIQTMPRAMEYEIEDDQPRPEKFCLGCKPR